MRSQIKSPCPEPRRICRNCRVSKGQEAKVGQSQRSRARLEDVRQIDMTDPLLASDKAEPRADGAWQLHNVAGLPALEEEP